MVIGEDIIFLDEVDSTNSYITNRLTGERIPEGTLVWTSYQKAGRGLDKNTWESAPGKNLTFSFVLYPGFLPVDRQFLLNKAISLAMVDLVKSKLPGNHEVKIKWPNDIYIGNRKVAGVLIQNGIKGEHFEYSIIGIGLNVNQETFGRGIPNPVSLKLISGRQYILENLLKKAIDFLQSRINCLIIGDQNQLDKDYLNDLYRYNEVHEFMYNKEKILARITGVNRYGQLLLEVQGMKIIECDLKEVSFLL